jgi:hypothetical protein
MLGCGKKRKERGESKKRRIGERHGNEGKC